MTVRELAAPPLAAVRTALEGEREQEPKDPEF